MHAPTITEPFVLYQAPALSAYAERLIHGFTGKPITLGGPDGPTEAIWNNRHQLCRWAGLNTERLSLPRQTHSARFRLNDTPDHPDGSDAVVLTQPGVAAMIQVADCVPVLLYDPQAHVGAAIHAGWRGTAQGISAHVAQALVQDHGAKPEHLIAVIGPAISGCCYEVSPDVAHTVSQTLPARTPPEHYQTMGPNGKPHLDLKVVNQLQLDQVGLRQIDVLHACTQCQPQHLWSYRRGEAGRQVAYLQLG